MEWTQRFLYQLVLVIAHEITSKVLSTLLHKFRIMQLLSISLGFKQANSKKGNKVTDPEKCEKWAQKYILLL